MARHYGQIRRYTRSVRKLVGFVVVVNSRSYDICAVCVCFHLLRSRVRTGFRIYILLSSEINCQFIRIYCMASSSFTGGHYLRMVFWSDGIPTSTPYLSIRADMILIRSLLLFPLFLRRHSSPHQAAAVCQQCSAYVRVLRLLHAYLLVCVYYVKTVAYEICARLLPKAILAGISRCLFAAMSLINN